MIESKGWVAPHLKDPMDHRLLITKTLEDPHTSRNIHPDDLPRSGARKERTITSFIHTMTESTFDGGSRTCAAIATDDP